MCRCSKRLLLAFFLCASPLYSVQACGISSNNLWTVQLPSSTTPIVDQFTANIAGTSIDNEYSITITGNAGHVTQNNRTTDVIVKDQIPFGGSLVLYSLIGTDADSILMGWAYCTGNKLTSLFLEATDRMASFTNSTVTGSCNITNKAASVNLTTKDECVSVAQPSAVPTIDGSSYLSLQNGSVGNVTLGLEEFNLIPFAVIDCSDCAAEPSGGWFEVHSVMTSKTSADVCLGIFYLTLTCGRVSVDYVQCFMGNATTQTFDAGYDLSGFINSTETVNVTCKASPSPTSSAEESSSTGSSAGPELKIPFFALAMPLGLFAVYF